MVRVTRLLPVGVFALFASGLAPALVGGLGGVALSATALSAQEAAPAADDGAPARRGRRRGRERARPAEKKMGTPPGMQQATPVAIFGDWNVFVNGEGRRQALLRHRPAADALAQDPEARHRLPVRERPQGRERAERGRGDAGLPLEARGLPGQARLGRRADRPEPQSRCQPLRSGGEGRQCVAAEPGRGGARRLRDERAKPQADRSKPPRCAAIRRATSTPSAGSRRP